MLSETDDQKRPVAYNHVSGVVTGKDDGMHHVISKVSGTLEQDLGRFGGYGFTLLGQWWGTYWKAGFRLGSSYFVTDHGRDWSHHTAKAAANTLVTIARALTEHPIPAAPS